MTLRSMLVALALLLAACSRDGTETASTPAPAPAPPVATSPAVPPPTAESVPPATATALGTIDAIDAAAGTITIAHEPVAALNWPAMTMAFKATPEQLEGLSVGQRVQFEFVSAGSEATITTITAAN